MKQLNKTKRDSAKLNIVSEEDWKSTIAQPTAIVGQKKRKNKVRTTEQKTTDRQM